MESRGSEASLSFMVSYLLLLVLEKLPREVERTPESCFLWLEVLSKSLNKAERPPKLLVLERLVSRNTPGLGDGKDTELEESRNEDREPLSRSCSWFASRNDSSSKGFTKSSVVQSSGNESSGIETPESASELLRCVDSNLRGEGIAQRSKGEGSSQESHFRDVSGGVSSVGRTSCPLYSNRTRLEAGSASSSRS